jgi:hypothetical protein
MEGIHLVCYDFMHVSPCAYKFVKLSTIHYIPVLLKWEYGKLVFCEILSILARWQGAIYPPASIRRDRVR